MDNLTFVIYKKDKWVVETTNGFKVERREHGSRTQGIRALFQRHTGIFLFHIVILKTDTTEAQDFIFRKSLLSKTWRFNGKEYSSRIKAVTSFLHFHPKLTRFYISIPIEQGKNKLGKGIDIIHTAII